MKLPKKDKDVLAVLRLKKAGDALVEAKDNVSFGHWRLVVNRLYYACFYAASALLVKKGITAQTHVGVLNQLGLHFVKEGLISAEQNELYYKLFHLRLTGDYDDWVDLQEKDVIHLIEPTKKFIEEITKMIKNEPT